MNGDFRTPDRTFTVSSVEDEGVFYIRPALSTGNFLVAVKDPAGLAAIVISAEDLRKAHKALGEALERLV